MSTLIVFWQGGRAAGRFLLESKPELMVDWTWLVTVLLERPERCGLHFGGVADRIYGYVSY